MTHTRRAEPEKGSERQDLVIEDCRIWTEQGFREGSIVIEKGRISRLARRTEGLGYLRIRARGLVALPGPIDAHVHLRDMELAHKEDFSTGTSAAAAGGFTSVIDMPNTQPPTDSPSRLMEKMKRASGRVLVNVGFHVAAIPSQMAVERMAAIGAFSMKLYLPKPIFPLDVEDMETIRNIMSVAAKNSLPVTVHAEDARNLTKTNEVRSYPGLASTHPPSAERRAVETLLRLQKETECLLHLCHVSLSSTLLRVRGGSSSKVSSEVTPHHMLLSSDALRRKGWKAWMVPPLRSRQEARNLLKLVSRGLATLVGSDHAPHTVAEKKSSVSECPPGIPGLETCLPLLFTLVSKGAISLRRVVDLVSTQPARVFGLERKGRLAEGADGDVTLVDLKAKSKVEPENFFSKARYSPFEGFETVGRVHTTIVGGKIVYSQGQILTPPTSGKILRRSR